LPKEGEPAWHEARSAVAAISGRTRIGTDVPNPFETLTDPEGLALRADFLRQIKETGEAVVEYNGFRPDQTLIRIREHARILPGTRIHESLIIGQLTDITSEQNLKAKAHAAARLANLGEMATGLAHEINQPAAAIALAADIAVLELDRLPGEHPRALQRGLEDIAEQAARLREVIKHFRDFSRPDTDAQPLQSILLDEVIAGARRIADGILAGAGVILRVYLPERPLVVRARRVPLEQVLVNVLINARDALLHQPRIARVVDLSAAADEGLGTVTIRIRDYGTGFAPDILPHIFEPFFTTKSFEKGTGLGLSIAHTTMQGLGGSIGARNHPAGGAEFCMVLLADNDPRVVHLESETTGSRVKLA
jgi:C4-dicarboxylate-specific signal transduction histidine kinase